MANNSFDLDWANAMDSSGDNSDGFFPNMKLQPGKNQVRVVSKPCRVFVHWAATADGKQRRVVCPGDGCPLCQAGERPNKRYQMLIIDRAEKEEDKKLKTLECGSSIIKEIQALAREEEYGDPTTYDIKINKSGAGLETRYSVIASPKKTPISDEEKRLIEAAPSLSEINKVSTPEEIRNMNLQSLMDAANNNGDNIGGDSKKLDDDWGGI